MDIKISSDDWSFKYRVVGILRRFDGKFLVQKIEGNSFYCFPGGHVELGENTDYAAEREFEEELKFDVNIDKLGYIVENFFYSKRTNTKMHELGFYYFLTSEKCPQEDSWVVKEIDKGVEKTLEYMWVDAEDIEKLDLRPAFLKEELKQPADSIKRFVFREDL